MVKRLIVMRHAKSDYPIGVADHERPLAARGLRDAKVASAWLRDHADAFTLGAATAIVSSATRTQQTWDIAGRYLPGVRRHNEPALYEASVSTTIDLIDRDGVDTTYVVGHNPTMHGLVLSLVGSGDRDLLEVVANRFRTCAIAVLDLHPDHPWDNESATLVSAVVPRA